MRDLTEMNEFNKELTNFTIEYKNSMHSEQRLYYIFKKLLPYLRIWQINDPSKIIEKCDLESYGFEGFIKALTHFNIDKNNYSIPWFVHVIRQTIIKRLKEDTHYDKVFVINSTNSEDMDQVFENIPDDKSYQFQLIESMKSPIAFPQLKETLYKLLAKMEEDQNPKLSLAVQWKLAFPGGNNNGLYPFLGYKRRNPISKLKRRIKKYSEEFSVKLVENIFD